MHQRLLTIAASGALLVSAPIFAACSSSANGGSTGGVAITATDDACQVASTALKPGKTTFTVTNKGKKTTEVYVYGEQGGKYNRIVGEVENIGPGTSRDLTADLTGGDYEIACKPGQAGDGIRTRVRVDGPKAS